MQIPKDLPFSYEIELQNRNLSLYDNHIHRTLSSMQGQFYDQTAYQHMLSQADTLLYEVLEIHRPEMSGELLNGLSIVHSGKVGNEYFMTKGHFHAELATAEVYYCLQGTGFMVMENPEGDWAVESLKPGCVLYVPPRWAHRSVNTCDCELVTFFVYPGHAGHDYGTIERQGFRKLVIDEAGEPKVVDNPRWRPPETR